MVLSQLHLRRALAVLCLAATKRFVIASSLVFHELSFPFLFLSENLDCLGAVHDPEEIASV